MGRHRTGFAIALTTALGALAALAAPSPAANQFTTTIGARFGTPDAGVCALSAPLTERACTVAQENLVAGETRSDGAYATLPGRIRRWSVRSGPGTPGTTSVKLRLRVLPSPEGPGGPAGPFVELPLGRPGVQTFPANLPIAPFEGIGLDVVVTGSALSEAAAPIAHVADPFSAINEWSPLLGVGDETSPELTLRERAVLLSAEVERDDRQPPRTKLTYAPRQRFASTRVVDVNVRSSEKGRAFATGQIEIPATRHIYAILSDGAQVDAGVKERMRLRLERPAAEAVLRAIRQGHKVLAKVTVSVTDEAGNESGATVAVIRPRR